MLHGMLLTAYCYVLHGMLHAALSALHNYCVLHGMLCAALLCTVLLCLLCMMLCATWHAACCSVCSACFVLLCCALCCSVCSA